MHYYRFHVGDYKTHTAGLSPMEDLAYRRILDDYHLHEKPPQGSPQMIARRIGLPDEADAVAWVLEEYFEQSDDNCWINKRAEKEISGYQTLQEKGRDAASKRWHKGQDGAPMGNPLGGDKDASADAILTSNQEPITNNQKSKGRFTPPTVMEVAAYCDQYGEVIDAQSFVDFYQSKGWMVGKNKMKDWQAAVRQWVKRDKQDPKRRPAAQPTTPGVTSTRDMSLDDMLNDRSWAE